jgi:hypothetical protein
MRKEAVLFTFFMFQLSLLFAQSATQNFYLTLPAKTVNGSLYRYISLIDLREDTQSIGIIQKGAFNKKVKLVPSPSLNFQFSNLLNGLNGPDAKDGQLILVIREYFFAEITKLMSDDGYCHFRADLFSKEEKTFKRIAKIDTVVYTFAMDVTEKILDEGSKAISGFIAGNLSRKAKENDTAFSHEDLYNLENIEKAKIELYNKRSCTNGLYYSYASFSHQLPDAPEVFVEFGKKDKVKKVRFMNKHGRKKVISNKHFYAFVFQGKPFIAGEHDSYPLVRIGNDFYFTGRARSAEAGEVIAGAFFFGIVGAILVANTTTSMFEMKVDYVTGGFKRLREVPADQ